MSEFISEWWFLVVFVAIFVVYTIYISTLRAKPSQKKYESFSSSKSGWFLGGVILLGLVMPHIYDNQIVKNIGESEFNFLYFLYLAGVLISSYYFRKSSYFFIFLSNLVIASCWPRTEKMPLYMAGFIVLMSVIFYIAEVS